MDQMQALSIRRKWHHNVMNLILGKNVCGSCLRLDEDLTHWDVDFILERDGQDTERTLKNIMITTFGYSILDIVSTAKFCQKCIDAILKAYFLLHEIDINLIINNVVYMCRLRRMDPGHGIQRILDIVSTAKFCQKCIDAILKAYFLLHEIQQNYKHIQRRLTEISKQMKWTQHLDESGSLSEIKINDLTKTAGFNHVEAKSQTVVGFADKANNIASLNTSKITRRIILNDESLKTKLIKDPDMHKFLFRREVVKKTTLPAGITVKKVKDIMSDVAPHELLELNWADETDYDSVIPNTQVSKNQLHSNEALIMDLMEKAKTVDSKKYCHNTNYAATLTKTPKPNSDLSDSLTVNLIETPDTIDDSTDGTELVPQDLLELKWPEEQGCTTKHFMKIPVKTLNFDEGLTVKFIPKNKLCQLQENLVDLAPYELLELNWNDESDKAELENTIQLDKGQQKHNIDLTKWLEDQGMSTIKTNSLSNDENKNTEDMNNSERMCNANEAMSVENEKVGQLDILESSAGQNHHLETMAHTMKSESDTNTLDNYKLSCNNDVKRKSNEPEHTDKVDIRCALCNLIFDHFTSYTNHYKTHNIIESAKCYKCPSEFPVIELLSEHLLSIHLENVAYCNVCFAMLNQDKLAEHMSIYHSKRVEIINAPKDRTETSELRRDEYCKKCKQLIKPPPSDPHVCANVKSRCKECKHACIHEKYLSSYSNQLKTKKDTFKCPDCEYQYKTRGEIIKHANKVHLQHKPHVCKVCNIGFLLKTSLGRHNNLYHARCDSCRRVFKDNFVMSKHRCKNASKNDTKCELCGQCFTETKYQQHKQTALVATDECVMCQQTIPIKCNMSRHMQDIHNLSLKKVFDTIVYECTICEIDFQNSAGFLEHSWVHTGVHECHVCAKRFSSKVLYETHYQMHLTIQSDLEKRCKCSICGEQLIDKYAYAHHMQRHTDYGKCPICSEYIKNESLNEHVESHEVLESKFKCPHCPLISNSHSQFEVHVNRFHLQNRPYQCDICKKCFYSKHLMREHIKLHSRHEKCSVCDRKFARKGNLEVHMRIHENMTASS